MNEGMGYKWVWIGLAVALAPVVALALMSLLSRRPATLGAPAGKLAPCPASPNCVCSQADDEGHRVEPIAFTGDPAEAMDQLRAVIAGMPRGVVVTATDGYLHAEFTSLVFRFVDDVECVVDADRRVIHVRSASRAGRSDFGVNRARVDAIRRAFQGP